MTQLIWLISIDESSDSSKKKVGDYVLIASLDAHWLNLYEAVNYA